MRGLVARNLLLLFLVLPPLSAVSGPGTARETMRGTMMGVWGPAQKTSNIHDLTLTPGSIFTVDVNITGATNLYGYQLAFVYDPAILQATSTSLNNTIFTSPSVYEEDRPGNVFLKLNSSQSVFTGDGVLAHIELKVLALGTSGLGLDEVYLYPDAQVQLSYGCFHNQEERIVVPDFTRSPNPGPEETSEYMIGSVAVGIILPESIGPTLNWTDTEVNTTISGIYKAMGWWASREPRAHLSFSYDLHIRVPTSYEPSRMGEYEEQLWINEVMGYLGYHQPSAWTNVRAYDDDIRTRLGTDWAFTIFVVDSTSIGFADGGYAHAYLGGPWLTMARYGRIAYNGSNYFEAIPAHETGHIFYATDEYDLVRSYSGYLNSPDNDQTRGIMNRNTLEVSYSTGRQVGWSDCDQNGILDIQDTKPAVSFDQYSSTVPGTYTFTGAAVDVPFPRASFGRDISINKITSVEYNLDNYTWLPARPTDGSFDNGLERFAIALNDAPPGLHTLIVNATNSVGNISQETIQFTVQDTRVAANLLDAWPEPRTLRVQDGAVVTLHTMVVNTGNVPVSVRVTYLITDRKTGLVDTEYSSIALVGTGQTSESTSTFTPPNRTTRYFVEAVIHYTDQDPASTSAVWHAGSSAQFRFHTIASRP